MGGKARNRLSYPYPFVGHGVGYARKRIDCFVAFEQPLPKKLRSWVEQACPPPLSQHFRWTPRGLAFGSDDGIRERVIATYAGQPIEDLPCSEQWAALAADVDHWLDGISKQVTIACVVWPLDPELGHKTDAWHDWSMPLVQSIVTRHLADQGDEAAWFAERARAAWKASQAPSEPSTQPAKLEELVTAWQVALAGHGRHLELRFAEQAPRQELRDIWYAAEKAKDWACARHLCEQLLAQDQPPRYQDQWLAHHVEALLAQGELKAAQVALAPALLFASLYDNAAMLALLGYCLQTADHSQAAVVYHAGKELGTYFTLEAQAPGGLSHIELGDEPHRPAKLMQQFAQLYRNWIAPAWQPHFMSWGQLMQARLNFTEIHKGVLKAEIQAADADLRGWEHKADAVRCALLAGEAATLEFALQEFLARPIDSHSSNFLGNLATEFSGVAPEQAELLFRQACTYWKVSNQTLIAYFDLCTKHHALSPPEDIIKNLPYLARLGGYGTRNLLRSGLRYHRTRQNNTQAQEIEALQAALLCA